MARLCDLADPLVEVVYVAPFSLPEVRQNCLHSCIQPARGGVIYSCSAHKPRNSTHVCLCDLAGSLVEVIHRAVFVLPEVRSVHA